MTLIDQYRLGNESFMLAFKNKEWGLFSRSSQIDIYKGDI